MKAQVDQWSIVITGQWNPHIFGADWVAKNLLAQDEGEIQIQVGLSRGFPIRLRMNTERFTLVPAQERVQFHPRSNETEDLSAVEEAALKTLRILPHTPVTGYGINFHFTDDLVGEFDADIFNARDYTRLRGMKYEALERKIVRKLRIDDQTYLNLTLILSDDAELDIDLNFHRSIVPGDQLDKLADELSGKLDSHYQLALNVLEHAYNLILELEGDVDDE